MEDQEMRSAEIQIRSQEGLDYIRAKNTTESELQEVLRGDTPIELDWQNRWLKGEEYAHILNRIDKYCEVFKLLKYSQKTHPESIYIQPENGMIYFVKGSSIGSDFGFPRLAFKKKYKWKKMNFTTDLPKKDPIVSYIVASAVKCEKFFPGSSKEGPVYRMHAVILTKRSETQKNNGNANSRKTSCINAATSSQSSGILKNEFGVSRQNVKNQSSNKWAPAQNATKYILCHVRKVNNKKDSEGDDDDAFISEIKIDNEQSHEEMDMRQINNNIRLISDDVKDENIGSIKTDFSIETRTKSHTFKFDSMKKSLTSCRKVSETSMKLRRRAMTDGQSLIQEENPDKNIENIIDDSSHNSVQDNSLTISDLKEQGSDGEDSDFIIKDTSNKTSKKRRVQKLQRKNTESNNNLIEEQQNSQIISPDMSKNNSQLNEFLSPENGRKHSAQIVQDNPDQIELQQDAQLFAHLYTLQKRQKRSESLDYTMQTLNIDDKSTNANTNNVFNFTENFSKTTMNSPPQAPLPRPIPLMNNRGLYRKTSEVIGDKDRISAFKKFDTNQNFQLGQQIQQFKSPQLNPTQFCSPFNALNSNYFEQCFTETNDNLKLKSNILQNLVHQSQIMNQSCLGNQSHFGTPNLPSIMSLSTMQSQKPPLYGQTCQIQQQNQVLTNKYGLFQAQTQNNIPDIINNINNSNVNIFNQLFSFKLPEQQQQQNQTSSNIINSQIPLLRKASMPTDFYLDQINSNMGFHQGDCLPK
ncbi:UNKNOWN [Stylonychia lemnae]|uniref:Uncharacterized protein n=1 Tax=Stylonychia lemnae TaxID=5949 RepID=A0A077ZS36_STYLE|nr:UNKNOWN [Stylonychia lemnae]|eukprot:CDW72180.1 UNKNOWN [Stylonychia lemnae]